MFDGATILITGGTGSFGRHFTRRLLERHDPKKVIVFSRDELKQFEMRAELDAGCMRYFIGDVRDAARLEKAFQGVDYVVHAAALKHVPVAEYNPMECIKTNVQGTQNVIEAALANGVEKTILLSTDKAANPINLYGASKLAAEKLTIAANNVVGERSTRFSVVRYGNVMGSRGSVLPFFNKLLARGVERLPVTDRRMTRFWVTLDRGVEFVFDCFARMHGGETFVPTAPSMRILDLVEALTPGTECEEIGIRPGEKVQEILCPSDDSHLTLAFEDFYLIRPPIRFYDRDVNYTVTDLGEEGTGVPLGSEYNSANNPEFLSVDALRSLNQELVAAT